MDGSASNNAGRLLVVDDNEMNRDMLSRRLGRLGHNVEMAGGGEEALAMIAAAEKPYDVILLDIMMPDIDGLSVLKRLRETHSPTALPVIMATAKDSTDDIVEALQLGANDYVTKPLQFSIVAARIATQISLKRSVDRILDLEDDLQHQNEELSEINDRMKRDLLLAAGVQQAMLPHTTPKCDSAKFSWKYLPCDELAGDILNVFQLDAKHVAFYLIDVSGHGVAASLLSCTLSKMLTPAQGPSLVQTLDPATGLLTPTSPALVAAELNTRFPMSANAGQYFTLLYGVLDTETGLLRYVSAAHPGVLIAAKGADPEVCVNPGWGVGWIEDAAWEDSTLQMRAGDRLFLCSDGVSEAKGPGGEQFQNDRILKAICATRETALDDNVEAVLNTAAQWTPKFTDDVSIIAVEFTGRPCGPG
jgi:phosphoserine phosphatase RsbU/P